MVGHLVRLKLRLVRAGLRTGGRASRIGFVLSMTSATIVGLVVGAMGLTTRVASDEGAALGSLALLTGVLVVWVIGPLVSVGSEGSLEADRLVLLPLGGRDLVPGLCVASLAGAGGLATSLIVAGVVGGMAPGGVGLLVTLVAAGEFLLLCVASSRLLSTTLAAARSRRWRDFALFIGPMVAVVLNLVFQLVSRAADRVGEIDPRVVNAFRAAALFLPSGPPALAMSAARQGHLLLAVTALVLGAAYLVALMAAWWRALERTMTTAVAPTGPRRRARSDLFPAWVRFLPRTRAGAVAAKELRVLWRDPRQRAALLSSLFPAVLIAATSGLIRNRGPGSVLYGTAFVFTLGASSTNLFGFDGPRHWTNLAAGDDLRGDLEGKVLARLCLSVPFGIGATLVLALRHGDLYLVPAALGLCTLALGLTLGTGAWASIVAAYPMRDSENPWQGGQTGQAARFFGPSTVAFFGASAAIAPFVVATLAWRGSGALLMALIAVECAAAWVAWRLGLAAALRAGADRQPELLERLSPRRA